MTSSTARVRRGAAGGECLRADARLTVTLTAAVPLPAAVTLPAAGPLGRR